MRLEEKKITLLRKAKRVSQTSLAEAIHSHPLHIVKVEKGAARYSDELLELAKEFLGIKGMPLTQFECATCKERLDVMRDYIREARLKEAREICSEMANLINLEPCDNELPLLYRLYEVALLLAERNLDTAKAKFDYLQSHYEDMNSEHLHYFYSNKGYLLIFDARYEDALEHFKGAIEISARIPGFSAQESARLHVLVAHCYSYLEYPYRAIFYVMKNYELCMNKSAHPANITADLLLATNYIYVNNLKEVEAILNSCLKRAMSTRDDIRVGIAMHCYGLMYMKLERWHLAIEYLDKAIKFYAKESSQYLSILYRKIRSLVGDRKFSKARKLISETEPLHGTNEVFSTYFKGIEHYITVLSRMSLYNEPSIKYIETVVLPHLTKTYGFFEAIDYYKLLEAYYKTKNNKKSLLMSEAIRKIYERCLLYD